MKTYFGLENIEDNHHITSVSDSDFWFMLQHALLLGIKDSGMLSEMQFRLSVEALQRQHREAIRKICSKEQEND